MEVGNGSFSLGLDCANSCANDGYWMASWNGSCYCEMNDQYDYECDSYTGAEGYTTYKMAYTDQE
jgi:hypothetical protein